MSMFSQSPTRQGLDKQLSSSDQSKESIKKIVQHLHMIHDTSRQNGSVNLNRICIKGYTKQMINIVILLKLESYDKYEQKKSFFETDKRWIIKRPLKLHGE